MTQDTQMDADAEARPASPVRLANRAPVVDWPAVETDYRAGLLTLVQIYAKFGISRQQLYHRRQQEGWPPRRQSSPVDRTLLISRMFRVLERQVVSLDKPSTAIGDKEVPLLGNMARTLEKLIELEASQRVKGSAARVTNIAELRAKLAKRIEELSGR